MQIDYIKPLSRGWQRMKKALFQPLDLGKWFVVGFTAFLAALGEGPQIKGPQYNKGGHFSFEEFLDFPSYALDWLTDNPGWFILIIFACLIIIAFGILITWLSSRGKFMFLDNVIHDRSQVSNPWREFKDQGNSLFFWRLCFGLFFLAVFIMLIVLFFEIASNIYYGYYSTPITIVLITGGSLLILFILILMGYIKCFLNDFVVPIMYKHKIKTTQAWSQFLQLFSKYSVNFILYGLFIFVLIIFTTICIIIFGFFTCCLGFLLMALPYIGSVVTLPISYTFRGFSIEFLSQFGPEFNVIPQTADQETRSV